VPKAAAPMVIPFDGAYWYLKEWEQVPQADAQVAHGDPLKVKVNSTNALPVVMKAHQKLRGPVDLSCCSAVRLDVTNADKRPGVITVELELSDGTSAVSLLVLPSSGHEIAEPVHDSVVFRLPKVRRLRQFNEVTVQIGTTGTRVLSAPPVAVEGLALLP
jgi:hypothetical protein